MSRRWMLADQAQRVLVRAWRHTSGWWRVTLVMLLLLLLGFGGIFGLAITVLVLLLALSARIGAVIAAVRSRPVRYYAQEVERTHEVLVERLRWAEQEIAARDAHIARLQAHEGVDGDGW